MPQNMLLARPATPQPWAPCQICARPQAPEEAGLAAAAGLVLGADRTSDLDNHENKVNISVGQLRPHIHMAERDGLVGLEDLTKDR